MKPIVFLHIPKTAGQSIHSALSRAVGATRVSPVRVHTQVARGEPQFPPGYDLYSGHLDWVDLDALPPERFVFSVLRNPLERIASFYLYLLEKARQTEPALLERPENRGLQMISSRSADDYFLGGPPPWTRFILDHYDNFYCSYLATRRMRGHSLVGELPAEERLDRALSGLRTIDRVYSVSDLAAFEADARSMLGLRLQVRDHVVNAGPEKRGTERWPLLVERFERDDTKGRIEAFAEIDQRLMDRLGLRG